MAERQEKSPSQAYTADARTLHLWGIGGMADYMLFVSFNALILPIFTTAFGLSPVLVGWALMLPRITDALVDPILGHLSDDTHTRWGRRRPYLFGASILGAIVVMALWWASPAWPQGRQFAYLLTCSILLYFCYGVFSMTHVAFGYELSDDYHLRTKVVAIRGFYFSIAALAGGWLYWLALRPVFGGEIAGIRWISAGIAAVILVAGLIPFFCCRERFQNANRRHVNLWKAIRATLRVRPFVIILLLRVAQTLGGSLFGAMAFYIGVYSVCGGNKSLFTSLSGINGMVGFAAAFTLMRVAPWLSRRLGKRRAIIWGYGAAFLGAMLMPFFMRPGHPYLLLTHMITFGLASAVLTMFMAAVMPDICDLDELESGERREGLFSAVMSFVSKIENSVCILLGGYLVAFSGFDTHVAQQMGQQPQAVLDKMRLLGFTPAIVFAGVTFAIACYFPITQKMMTDVRARLDARRAAASPS